MAETIRLRVDSIAAGGDGVGRHNGRVVFVPRAAPGDVAEVVAEPRGKFMRGRIARLIEPSPQRVDPACDHYVNDRCGGCQLQHVSYDGQIEAKATIIRDALVRIGRIEMGKPEVEPSGGEWRYRRKLTLKLRRTDAGWTAGLHRYDAPDEIFQLVDCPITQEQVLAHFEAVLDHGELLPDERELRAAVLLLPDGFSFTLSGAHEWRDHEGLFREIESMHELWWQPEGKSRRLLHSRSAGDQAGASFVQVNPAVARRLREYVAATARRLEPGTAVDAYAGTGDVAAELAALGINVVAIEMDRDAARVCAARLPRGSRAVAAAVEDALEAALPADLVVLNPPRAGLSPKVTSILQAKASAPKHLLYVSCDPATLARDMRRLENYRLASVRAFDMFPQTAHVETVCGLVRST